MKIPKLLVYHATSQSVILMQGVAGSCSRVKAGPKADVRVNLLAPLSLEGHVCKHVIPLKNIVVIFNINLYIFRWRQFIFH